MTVGALGPRFSSQSAWRNDAIFLKLLGVGGGYRGAVPVELMARGRP